MGAWWYINSSGGEVHGEGFISTRWNVRKLLIVVLMALSSSLCLAAPLPRSTPEEQGVSSSGVLSCIEALDKIEYMNSFMLVRHGQVVAEGWWAPYTADAPHMLY